MQMYGGTITSITLNVLNNLLAQKMATNGVRKCSIGSPEAVLNTNRNQISVECNMGYESLKTAI